jgi:hypothetical protein
MTRCVLAARHAGRVIPFSGKEMRRRTRAEGPELAHEMGLIGVPVGEREVGPRNGRPHDRLPPGPREPGEPFEPFRRHAHFVEKPPLEMTGRHTEFLREFRDRNRYLGAEQSIDRADASRG